MLSWHMSEKPSTVPIFEMLDQQFAKECEAALTRYRSGDDEVAIEFGELKFRLFDRKDNADRETVRMSMEEFLNAIRMCHINGAVLATSTMAQVAASLAGLKVVDDDAVEDETP